MDSLYERYCFVNWAGGNNKSCAGPRKNFKVNIFKPCAAVPQINFQNKTLATFYTSLYFTLKIFTYPDNTKLVTQQI